MQSAAAIAHSRHHCGFGIIMDNRINLPKMYRCTEAGGKGTITVTAAIWAIGGIVAVWPPQVWRQAAGAIVSASGGRASLGTVPV